MVVIRALVLCSFFDFPPPPPPPELSNEVDVVCRTFHAVILAALKLERRDYFSAAGNRQARNKGRSEANVTVKRRTIYEKRLESRGAFVCEKYRLLVERECRALGSSWSRFRKKKTQQETSNQIQRNRTTSNMKWTRPQCGCVSRFLVLFMSLIVRSADLTNHPKKVTDASCDIFFFFFSDFFFFQPLQTSMGLSAHIDHCSCHIFPQEIFAIFSFIVTH